MANTSAKKIEGTDQTPAQLPAIVVNLGKVSRSSLKKLRRGRGKLMTELDEVLAQVKHEIGSEAEGSEILPVVLVCQKKRRKRRRGLLSLID